MGESGPVSEELHKLNEVLTQVKIRQESHDDGTTSWQRRIETKLDQQLKLLTDKGREILPTVVGTSPEILQHSWLTRSDEDCLTIPLPGLMASAEHRSPCPSVNGNEKGKDIAQSESDHQASKEESCVSIVSGTSSKRLPPSALKKTQSSRKVAKSGFFNKNNTHHKKKADQTIFKQRKEEILVAQTKLYKFTTDKRYEIVAMAMILLNAFCVGFQVQAIAYRVEVAFLNGQEYVTRAPGVFYVLQLLFNIFFVGELGLRWIGEGFIEFIKSIDFLWNSFDIITVIAGLVELVLDFADPDYMTVASISVIRCLRILRIVRLVKLIRVYPFFHELRMMVESCLNSLKSYTWCISVLLLMTYLFAIFLTTGTCSHLADNRDVASANNPKLIQLHEFFGSVDKSMLSLFQTIAGGRDWFEFYEALLILGVNKTWIYLFYISFVIFAVYNVMAAVFVESAFQSSAHDRELLIREALRDSKTYQEKMLAVFEEMDADGTGTLTEDEFLAHLDDERVIAYFDSMKLDISDATSLFKLLDVDHSGSVEIAEFIEGCQRLKGESRSLDMHLMRFELQAMRFEVTSFISNLCTIVDGQTVKHQDSRDKDGQTVKHQDSISSSATAMTVNLPCIPDEQKHILSDDPAPRESDFITVIPSAIEPNLRSADLY